MKVVVLARSISPFLRALALARPDAVLVLEQRRLRERLGRTLRRIPRHLASLRPAMLLHPLVLARIVLDNVARRLPRPGRTRAPRLALRTYHVDDHNGDECERILAEEKPDLIVVQATRILAPRIFGQARLGAINYHKGLLPYWRGSDIPFWALLADREQGFTIHYIDAGIDTGAIICQETVDDRGCHDEDAVRARIRAAGTVRMLQVIADMEKGPVPAVRATGHGPMHRRHVFGDRFDLELAMRRRRAASARVRTAAGGGSCG